MKLKLKRKDKEKKTSWTEKVGNKIGGALSAVFSNKIARVVIITALLIILFVFIVPIKKNIISICILIVLTVLWFIFKQLEKR